MENEFHFIHLITSYYSEIKFYENLLVLIKDNLNKINELWEKSDKKNRIAIYYYDYSDQHHLEKFQYNKTIILENENKLVNKYLNNLLADFNNEVINQEINIGIIDNESKDCILNEINNKYKNVDINQFEVERIENYSHFIKGYFAKLKVKNDSEKYSSGILKTNFFLILKTKLVSYQIK